MHTNNTSLGPTYHLQDVQSESQHTENETILGDFCRLDQWHYSIEWLALYPTVSLLLFQLFCICEYHLPKMLVQLHTNTLMHLHTAPWCSDKFPWRLKKYEHSTEGTVKWPFKVALHLITTLSLCNWNNVYTICRTMSFCALDTTSNPGDNKLDSQCYHAVKFL